MSEAKSTIIISKIILKWVWYVWGQAIVSLFIKDPYSLTVSWFFLQRKGAGVVCALIEYLTPLQTLSNTTYMSAPDHVPAGNTALELVTGN